MEQKAAAYLDQRTENDEDAKELLKEPMSGLKKNWRQQNQSNKLEFPDASDDQATSSC